MQLLERHKLDTFNVVQFEDFSSLFSRLFKKSETSEKTQTSMACFLIYQPFFFGNIHHLPMFNDDMTFSVKWLYM